MNAAEIRGKLATIAPHHVVRVTKQHDPDAKWDGDGPPPGEYVFAYVVTVSVTTIQYGGEKTAHASLAGVYLQYGEDPDDIGGYLPQMLVECFEFHCEGGGYMNKRDRAEAVRAVKFLQHEMDRRYAEQQSTMRALEEGA